MCEAINKMKLKLKLFVLSVKTVILYRSIHILYRPNGKMADITVKITEPF